MKNPLTGIGNIPYHHGNLRQSLLVDARALLEEKGLTGLGVRELSRRRGVTAAAVYHHFTGLQAIAIALAEQGFAELLERMELAPSNDKGHLLPTGMAYIQFGRENPELYRLMYGAKFVVEQDAHDAVRNLRQQTFQHLRNELAKRIPEDAIVNASVYLWSLVHGLTLLVIDGQLSTDAHDDLLIESVLRLAGKGLPTSV